MNPPTKYRPPGKPQPPLDLNIEFDLEVERSLSPREQWVVDCGVETCLAAGDLGPHASGEGPEWFAWIGSVETMLADWPRLVRAGLIDSGASREEALYRLAGGLISRGWDCAWRRAI